MHDIFSPYILGSNPKETRPLTTRLPQRDTTERKKKGDRWVRDYLAMVFEMTGGGYGADCPQWLLRALVAKKRHQI